MPEGAKRLICSCSDHHFSLAFWVFVHTASCPIFKEFITPCSFSVSGWYIQTIWIRESLFTTVARWTAWKLLNREILLMLMKINVDEVWPKYACFTPTASGSIWNIGLLSDLPQWMNSQVWTAYLVPSGVWCTGVCSLVVECTSFSNESNSTHSPASSSQPPAKRSKLVSVTH